MAGKAGRYRSMASGPKALNPPRISNRRNGMGYPGKSMGPPARAAESASCQIPLPLKNAPGSGMGGTLLLVQTRIELIHHGRPLRIPLELLAQEGRLSRRPEGSIHQLHVLGQSVGGEEALDRLVVRGQPELVEQGGQVLIG